MTPYNTFLIFLILSVPFVVRTTTAFTLPVGAILDTNSRIGREQKVAIDVATKRFNSSSQVIILNSIDLRSNNPREAASYAQGLIQQGAQIIISSGTWPQLLSISDVSKEAEIPTASLTPSMLLGKPFLTQLSYPDTALVNCLVDLVKSYRWQRVITVYENDIYGTVSGTAQQLAHALQDVGILVDYSAVFPSMDLISDPTTTIRAELARVNQQISTVYIILRSSENLTFSLFHEAKTLGMMEQGSVWVCGPDIVTLLDSTLNGSFIVNHMQGVIGVEPYIKESESEYTYHSFHSEFRQAFRSEYEKNGETSFNPGVYAVRAYDAIHAISLAADRSQVNGNSLMDNLGAINFTGLSGLVRPETTESIKGEGNYSNFRVVNVVGNGYKTIGYWSERFGFYKNESDQLNLNGSTLQGLIVLLWPGETIIVPGGLQRLRVGVPLNPPEYADYGFVKFNDETKEYVGFCVDVFKAALRRLKYTIEINFVPFVINDSSITFDNFLHQVYLKNFDIAIGDITITSGRSEKVSFTEPIMESGLTMIVPLKHENAGFLLATPFHWKLWTTFFSLLVYNFGVIWYLEIRNRFDGPWYKQLVETFWIVGNTFFQNHGRRIESYYARIVIISWLLVLLIMISCFTANLSSILVIEKLKPVIDKSIVGCEDVSFVRDYVEHVLNFKNIAPIKVPEEFSREFENGTITTGIMESPYARIFLSKHKKYSIHGDTHMLGGFGFALQKNDPLTAEFSKAILELQEDGTMKSLETKWFPGLFSGSEIAQNNVDDWKNLQLIEFWPLFVFGFTVATIMVVTFTICEHGNPGPDQDDHVNRIHPIGNDEHHVVIQIDQVPDENGGNGRNNTNQLELVPNGNGGNDPDSQINQGEDRNRLAGHVHEHDTMAAGPQNV